MYIKLIPVLNQAEPVNRMFLLCITLGTSVAASSRHRELRQVLIINGACHCKGQCISSCLSEDINYSHFRPGPQGGERYQHHRWRSTRRHSLSRL
ncbi:hypothetical protein Plhal304r1_c005g0021181 [Plasmopara halstedii]